MRHFQEVLQLPSQAKNGLFERGTRTFKSAFGLMQGTHSMMKPRRIWPLRTLSTLIIFSLFYSALFAILESFHRIHEDHTVYHAEVNSGFNGLPSLVSHNNRKINASGIFQDRKSDDLFKEQGRALTSLLQWRTSNGDMTKYNNTEAKKKTMRPPYLGCRDITAISVLGLVGRGYTKTVQKGVYQGTEVAIKSVQLDNEDITQCIKRSRSSVDECFIFAKYKLAKEIIMLQQLQHANIVKLLGFCWQNELNDADVKTRGLTMVTEVGSKLDVIRLIQLPWHERFRICLGLARLLEYLSNSPLGSLIIRDFKLSQFVLVGGEIKLTDFDDVDNDEPKCSRNSDCLVKGSKRNKTLPCNQGRCQGVLDAKNLGNVGRNFINHILTPGGPEHLMVYLNEIKNNVQRLAWDSGTLVWHMERVLSLLRSGKHVETISKLNLYKKIDEADFPNLHDYHCPETRLFGACELAVYDVNEAEYRCDLDKSCKAFVTTEKFLWSGYFIVYLKDDTSNMQPNKHTSVYVKHPT